MKKKYQLDRECPSTDLWDYKHARAHGGGRKRRRGPRLCRYTREVHEGGGGCRCSCGDSVCRRERRCCTTVLRRRGVTPRSFSRFSQGKPCRRLLLVEVSTRSALSVSEVRVQLVGTSTDKDVERITEYSESNLKTHSSCTKL